MRLESRRAAVTGAARGIGAEIAARLTAEGAQVVILDRLAERGAETAERLGARFVEVDLASPESARAALTEAIRLLGGIDILVNCAGILRLTPLLDITPEEFDTLMAVNARAQLITMQVAVPVMIEQGRGGRIVNLASMAAKKGGAHEAHYAASKAAVVALTRAAALEFGEHGITANAVCPGYVPTEMGAATRTDQDIAQWASLSPLNRLGTPADVAGVVAFLASDDAAYMTGQAVNVTGGMVMH